jgi:hypothetical protein
MIDGVLFQVRMRQVNCQKKSLNISQSCLKSMALKNWNPTSQAEQNGGEGDPQKSGRKIKKINPEKRMATPNI